MKTIYLFSNCYPYGMVSESFLTDELQVASKLSCCYIEIIPLYKNKYKRELPSNVILNNKLADLSFTYRIKVFFLMILSRYFWLLSFQGKYSPKSISDYYQAIKYLFGSFLIKNFLLKYKTNFVEDAVFYSYWFNHTPLGFCMAKESCKYFEKNTIYTRAHGFDVYEENVGTYFPYRNKVFTMIDKVFIVSDEGVAYMKKKYPTFVRKIDVSRLGVFINHVKKNIENYWEISILSCSNIIPVKRVNLIFESINNFCKENSCLKIKWTHIGGGNGFEDLQEKIKSKQSNLTVNLVGAVNKVVVQEIYKKEYFNLFINVSLSEGVPVSIMEAISWGIPVLATDVGGNKEIIMKNSGLLLPVNFSQKQFNNSLLYLVKYNNILSDSAYEFCLKNYNAEINYTNFYINQLK